MIKEVNLEDFQREVLESDLPVFVDFWAEWCGPCRAIAPIIDNLAEEYKGKLKFVKVNVDLSPEIATKYGILTIPTMLIFYQGRIIAQTVGKQSKAQLKNFLKEALEKV